MIENDLIFFETKIKIKINFYKFTGGDLDHLKDQVQLKDLDLFHQDQLILNNPEFSKTTADYPPYYCVAHFIDARHF